MKKTQNCFIISPIGEPGTETYDSFKEILDEVIRPTLESMMFGIKVMRADEISKSGSIIKDIIEHLANDTIVIADLTKQNSNVFYELGIRHSLKFGTILIASNVEYIPFDLKPYRTIIYSLNNPSGINAFKEKLKHYASDILSGNNKIDNPVQEYLSKDITNNEVNFNNDEVRRKHLSFAMLGIPDQRVVKNIAKHLLKPNPEKFIIGKLSDELSSLLGLSNTIIFRQNTSKVFKDILLGIVYHTLFHKSRKLEGLYDLSERILSNKMAENRLGDLFYTDMDHPSLEFIIKQVWPKKKVKKIIMSDIFFSIETEYHTEKVLNKILNRLNCAMPNVLLIPHVNWINGAILDINKITRFIKERHPFIQIIVDGAQAVGNIPINFESPTSENDNIDFYLGCGHKWLCGPETVGFARLSNRILKQCSDCEQFYLTNDQLTESRNINNYYLGEQIGTNQRGLAAGFYESLKINHSEFKTFTERLNKIRKNKEKLGKIFHSISSIQSINTIDILSSNIISFKIIDMVKAKAIMDALNEHGFSFNYYTSKSTQTILKSDSFIRLSPGPYMTEMEFQTIESIISKST
jgi:selenocysteine lyase/cysteine desulfurase